MIFRVLEHTDSATEDGRTDTQTVYGWVYRCVPETHLDKVVAQHVLPHVCNMYGMSYLKRPPVFECGDTPHTLTLSEFYYGRHREKLYCKSGDRYLSVGDAIRAYTATGWVMHTGFVSLRTLHHVETNTGWSEEYRLCSDEEILIHYIHAYLRNHVIHDSDHSTAEYICALLLDSERLDKIDLLMEKMV